MLPTQDTIHVAEGLGYVIGQYKNKPDFLAFLTVCSQMLKEQQAQNAITMQQQAGKAAPPRGQRQL